MTSVEEKCLIPVKRMREAEGKDGNAGVWGGGEGLEEETWRGKGGNRETKRNTKLGANTML